MVDLAMYMLYHYILASRAAAHIDLHNKGEGLV